MYEEAEIERGRERGGWRREKLEIINWAMA